MNIIYIDPQSYNNLADYDKYLLENIKEQKKFFCSTNLPYTKIDNTEIIRIYNYQDKKGIIKVLSYCFSQISLLKEIKRHKPSVIHFQWFKIPVFDYYVLKLIKKISSKSKIVHTAHNKLPHDSGAKYKKIYKKIYLLVDNIIVHAEITRNEICKEFSVNEEKITVIPHGFLPTKFKYKKTSLKDDVITFSFIGFLSDYKGLDILLDAWCVQSNIIDNNKCRLIIAGAGKVQCLNKIPENKNIVLENYFHSEEELAKIISCTDIAVLPYRQISQSGVLLTYLAEHIPVIVSKIGGLVQPFEIGNVGWILDELNAQALANILEKIIKDKDELNSINKNDVLWNRIDDFYDWKNIGGKTLNLYRK